MATDLDNLLERLNLMQKAVVTNSDAVPVSFYAQEGTPYWTNRIVDFTLQEDSEQLQIITYTIEMLLVLGSVTEGFKNEAERRIHTWLPTVLLYFGQRRQLKRTVADAPLTNLYPQGSLITGGRADYNLQNTGIGTLQFGISFTIDVPMYQSTDQVIY